MPELTKSVTTTQVLTYNEEDIEALILKDASERLNAPTTRLAIDTSDFTRLSVDVTFVERSST